MADQVNPLGTLAPGLPPTPAAAVPVMASRAPSAPDPTPRIGAPATSPEAQGVQPTSQSPSGLQAAAQDVQKYLAQASTQLQFDVDRSTGRFLFKVVNSRTKQVIYQVPSEEVLAMARKLRELDHAKGASGVLVDKEG